MLTTPCFWQEMPKPLTDTDIDVQFLARILKMMKKMAANTNHFLMKIKKTQLLMMIQNKHLRGKKIQDLLFGDPIYLVGLLL
jgi:hypothetical protein